MSGERPLEPTLSRVTLRMASSLELDGVLAEMTKGLVRDLDASLARVWLLRSDDSTSTPFLQLVASAGLSDRLDGRHGRVAVGSLKIGEIAATRARFCTNDLLADPRFTDRQWIRDNALRAFGGYPLFFGDQLLGVLAVFGRRPLTELDLEHLEIFAAQASIAIKKAQLFEEVSATSGRLEGENMYLRKAQPDVGPAGIVGHGAAILRVLREVERVAPTSSTVLLRGETGTGKELFARAIHDKSTRRKGPLVEVNCAAIAPSLIESELFGHERGAFTGAVQRRLGRFELAQKGTLFLDEIGELPLEAQAKLLRALQEHTIDRVGGSETIHVDVRIVAATNRDLEALVRENRFRADLFYRLAVFPIVVPPLRERREDIADLVAVLVPMLAARHRSRASTVDEEALLSLQAYDWPGNVCASCRTSSNAPSSSRRVRASASPTFPTSPAARASPSPRPPATPLRPRRRSRSASTRTSAGSSAMRWRAPVATSRRPRAGSA